MAKTKKRLDGYRRLIDISRDLASTLDLDALLNRIIWAAKDLAEAEAASILLYDDAARQLYFQAATNLDEPMRRGLVVPLEGSIAGWIVLNKQPVRSANAHKDPRHYQNIEQATSLPTESLLGVPMIAKDKVIGVLEAINKADGDFSEEDEEMLLVLGAQAAVAIENARLFQQSDLIAEFVHELRTPLASIGTSTYLLLRPEMSQEQREQMIHNIHGETLRLNALASAFLDLARLESGRVQFRPIRFDLMPLLEECKQTMQGKADESSIAIIIDVPSDFPQVSADRDKFKQVVLNFLSNAIKYNCPNGNVTLCARMAKNEWLFDVQDTGLGIPEKSLPHLFEKFYRVRAAEGRAPGTGLGLSICKQIVAAHGGRIEVKSELGKGTTFSIHMPFKQAK
jgi:signal transduction histidine kinase